MSINNFHSDTFKTLLSGTVLDQGIPVIYNNVSPHNYKVHTSFKFKFLYLWIQVLCGVGYSNFT